MSRTFVHEALVLSVRASGESNREATFLTAEEGLIRATMFGGPKSRLRAHVASWHRGTLWLYHDPVRDSRKVTDFDVRSWRPGIREMLERTWAASAIADTIQSTLAGGGEWVTALALADDSLDAIDLADAEGATRTLIRFLWKWADFLGARPEIDACGACAGRPKDDEVVWYSRSEGALFCGSCVEDLSGFDPDEFTLVGPGARRWLGATERMDARAALRVGMDAACERQAKRLATEILAVGLGKRLKTWDGWDVDRL